MKTLKTDDSLGSKDIDKRLAVYLVSNYITKNYIYIFNYNFISRTVV
jgi:inorganic pyrophosphatase